MSDAALIKELVEDAKACPRLTQWEEEFLEDMRHKVDIWGEDIELSEKQEAILRRIEAKVYAT